MKEYWLSKLLCAVGHVDSRKRLQKSIYLLQRKGCPLVFDYFLHYYGPYSSDLADLTDRLDSAGIIEETSHQDRFGNITYKVEFTEKGSRLLDRFEETDQGRKMSEQIDHFVSLFKKLTRESVARLELAATAAFLYDGSWEKAGEQTARFKKVEKKSKELAGALALGRKFVKT